MATHTTQFIKKAKCIFCANPAESDEHPLPQWLDKVLGPRLNGAFHFQTRSENQERRATVKKKSGEARSKRLPVVCIPCNTKWMSQLQDSVKPVLTALIKDEAITLNSKEKNILAAWMTMTTMVLEFDDARNAVILERERNWFRSVVIPPPGRWMIFAGRLSATDNYDLYFHRPGTAYQSGTEPHSSYNFQRTFLAIGQVILVAFSATAIDADSVPPFAQGADEYARQTGFVKIWPPSELAINWHSLPIHTPVELEMLAYENSVELLLDKYFGILKIREKKSREKPNNPLNEAE